MQESDLDLIEKYILNLLDDKTKSEFEIRLKSDKALQQELDAYTLAIQSFRTSQKPDIRNHLIELENKIKKKETLIETVKYILWSVFVIAIAFLMYKYFLFLMIMFLFNSFCKYAIILFFSLEHFWF